MTVDEVAKARARVRRIADAAPELYEVCQRLTNALRVIRASRSVPADDSQVAAMTQLDALINQGLRALAKAEGRNLEDV